MKKKIGISFKLGIGIIVSMLVVSTVVSLIACKLYRKNMENKYSEIAFDQASLASYYIDGDTIAKYLNSNEKDEYYEQIRLYLLEAKKLFNLDYFYVVIPEDEQQIYIWDAGDPGEEGVCDLGDTDIYYADNAKELMQNAMNPSAKDTVLITNSEEYGYIASAYKAIVDSSGKSVALASVDISMDVINSDISSVVSIIIGADILMLIVSIIFSFFYFRKVVLSPISTLDASTKTLIKQNLSNLDTFNVNLKTGDEFEDLANSFNFMGKSLQKQIDNLSKITAEKERIGAELDVARHIQSSMLPCIFPAFPDCKEFDIYATMLAAKEVGGDFYDFFKVDDKHIALVVADVSGKGVPAALFMVIGKTLIKDHTVSGKDLGQVFSEVNNILCESNSEGLFITAFEAIINIETGECRYVNAGHEMPIIQRKDGEFEVHKIKHGFVLAGMEDMNYKEEVFQLNKGDRIYLYTDGVPEATNINNELFNIDRTLISLNKHKDLDCNKLLPAIKKDIDEFVGDAPQFDDITMLCFELKE